MHRLPVALFIVLIAGAAIAADSNEDKKSDADGTWVISSMEIGGTKVPDEALKQEDAKLTLAGDKWSLKMGDKTSSGTTKVDKTKKPLELDITTTEGAKKGTVMKAIVELTGDTMKACYDLSGNERPKEFSTKDKPTYALIEYKREKN